MLSDVAMRPNERRPTGPRRRDVLRLAPLGVATMIGGARSVAAATTNGGLPVPATPERLAYDVLWRGQAVGTHDVDIEPVGDRMSVRMKTAIRVRIGFITVYRYEQTCEEDWAAGRLRSLTSTTNDDGRSLTVGGQRIGDNIELRGPGGPFVAPIDALTTTSVWSAMFVQRTSVIDIGDGTLVGLVVSDRGAAPVETGGGMVDARRYDIMTPFLAGSLWYPTQGRLVRARIERKGETLDYVARA